MSSAPPPAGAAGSAPGEGAPAGSTRGEGTPPLLAVSDLSVSFASPHGPVPAVDGVSFDLRRGELLAIVGESGAGKSVCALSLLGLLGAGASVRGSALLEGDQLIGMPAERLRRVRGARAAMVFQDPSSSLNPVMHVGKQIAEQIRAHEPHVSRATALERAGELMERMSIPSARARVRSYPHELSGGMRQRVVIAMALSLEPGLLIADEPTTALDVTVQAQILGQLKRLRDERRLGIVLITHDLAVVADVADRIAVMQAGRIVEQGPAADLLRAPRHPHTRALLQALVPPVPRRMPARVQGAPSAGAPLLEVEGLRVSFRIRGTRARVHAVDGVSLDVAKGETLAVVGESGSGKTTLLRAIARLTQPDAGTVRFAGEDVTRGRGRRLAPLRAALGMVFQDPQASLNPRRRVGRTLALALRARGAPGADAAAGAQRLLAQVGLTAVHAARYPHQLSGGERQRVAIARALAGRPRLVLLDEPVSSLDASLRRGVTELLASLQGELGCGYVLVSHDLSLVAGIADRIAVMHAGQVVELGAAEDVLQRPQHPYTRELLAASPALPGGVGSPQWAHNP